MRRIFAMTAGLAAVAQAAGLSVALPPADGFVVGHKAAQGRAILVELVPKGETVQAFTRMISLQTAPGLGAVPAPQYMAEFAKRYIARCPGATALAVPMGAAGGIRIDCGRHPATGKPETVFVRALPVGPDMGLVHVTLKYLAMPKEAQWARDYLGKVALR